MNTYAYYAGCTLSSIFPHYDTANRLVAENVDCQLASLEAWNCCGALSLPTANHLLSLALPLRNLALAEEKGRDLLVACGTCLAALRRSYNAYLTRRTWQSAISEVLARAGRSYTGKAKVHHIVEMFTAPLAIARFRRHSRKTFFRGMRLAVYYGCQVRDGSLESLLFMAGATVLPFDQKNRCCGSHAGATGRNLQAAFDLFKEALARQASHLVVVCSLCYLNLTEAWNRFPGPNSLQVSYFSEILAEALGVMVS